MRVAGHADPRDQRDRVAQGLCEVVRGVARNRQNGTPHHATLTGLSKIHDLDLSPRCPLG